VLPPRAVALPVSMAVSPTEAVRDSRSACNSPAALECSAPSRRSSSHSPSCRARSAPVSPDGGGVGACAVRSSRTNSALTRSASPRPTNSATRRCVTGQNAVPTARTTARPASVASAVSS
jgi:hypothetical protein